MIGAPPWMTSLNVAPNFWKEKVEEERAQQEEEEGQKGKCAGGPWPPGQSGRHAPWLARGRHADAADAAVGVDAVDASDARATSTHPQRNCQF